MLDAVGVVDPFGISDGINALIYLGQGDFKNAGISALGIVPYIGDTAKGARLGAKALKFADKADDVADAGKALTRAKGWKVGDPIDNLTRAGKEPSWSAVRSRYWKNEAYNNPEKYSVENLGRMKKGKAPLENRFNQSIELHHKEGRSIVNPHNEKNLEPLTPWEHGEKDPYRHYKGPKP